MSKPTKRDIALVICELSRKQSADKLAKTIADYLVQERRTGELDAIMREVLRQRHNKDGISEVTLSSAFPLSKKTKASIAALVGGKNVVINENIDTDLLGGVRVESNEEMLDLTVRTRLNRLKQGASN